MFDDLRCEMPLPFPEDLSGVRFQTKSFGCELDLITIKADGSLVVSERSGLDFPVQEIRPDFLGHVRFYTSRVPGWREWIEFEAAVVDGKVRSIVLVEHRPAEPESPRLDPAITYHDADR